MRHVRAQRPWLAFFILGLLLSAPAMPGAAPTWTPLTPAEAAQTDSLVEPGAGAEIISRRVSIDDSNGNYAEYQHYLRVKIFNAAGVEDFLSHKIEYDRTSSVTGIEARTYKPDGTTVVLDKKSILDQQIVRHDSTRIRAKVVALPGVEPGCVIELRWTELRDDVQMIPMSFQGRHPARSVHYDFRAYEGLGLESISVNYRGPVPKLDSRGRYQLEMTNIKAYKDEPFAPPDVQTKPWLLIWYSSDRSETVEKYWQNYCRKLDELRSDRAKPRGDVSDRAKTLAAGAGTEDEKLRRLYEFCVTKIKNQNYGYAGFTDEQRKNLKANQTPSDTLKHARGTRTDINYLFIALARALNIDARLALVGDRDSFVPSVKYRHGLLFRETIVAIPREAGWLFLDPGSIFLPYGLLAPDNEGVTAVISDPKQARHAVTPMTSPETSAKHRRANLALSADGDLSGTVEVHYTGLQAFATKYDLEGETAGLREDYVRKEVARDLPLAVVTDVTVAGADSPTEPLKISYRLRVPNYADRTGQRLLFQPAVFQKGRAAYFTAETRENNISFRNNLTIYDEMRIALPSGFGLEEAVAPVPLFDLGPIGRYRTQISVVAGKSSIIYQRELTQRFIVVPPVHYTEVKRGFDFIHTQDNHTLSLLASGESPGVRTP